MSKNKKFMLLLFVYFLWIIIIILGIYLISNLFFAEPKLVLNGDSQITLNVFDKYDEQGATAIINNSDDISDRIKIDTDLNTNVIGKYYVTYSVSNYMNNSLREASRTINVVDVTPPEIALNGDSTIYLYVNDTYTEKGAVAKDNYDGDITSNIVITGNVNTAAEGTYTAVYTITDSSGNSKNISRTVIVKKKEVPVVAKPPVIANATYIAVSIADQKLWFYLNGSLYLTSNVITGRKGIYDTPKGTFSIYSKARDTHLKGVDTLSGEPYDSFVNFWIPFYQGYGLHDASWQPSFGGNLYTYRGSHGCINLPYSTAQAIYNNAPIGTMVKIY